MKHYYMKSIYITEKLRNVSQVYCTTSLQNIISLQQSTTYCDLKLCQFFKCSVFIVLCVFSSHHGPCGLSFYETCACDHDDENQIFLYVLVLPLYV